MASGGALLRFDSTGGAPENPAQRGQRSQVFGDPGKQSRGGNSRSPGSGLRLLDFSRIHHDAWR
jgi:hypothetical protein